MTQIIAYKVYTTGTSLAYCGVAGSAADAYVPSGTAICSDPFLQDQIATADGTDWQYVGENRSWTQPTMTGNQMTLGGSVWGIYESGGQTGNLWKISDKNGSTYWDAGRPGLPINVIFYNPNAILATSVYFYNYSSDGINNYNFSGSNDNSTWTQLSSGTGKGHNQQWTDTITTSTAYKYFRLQVTQTLDSSGWLNLREVTISGTENVVADPVVSDLGSDSVRMFAAVPVTSYPYAHYEGTIYDIADAPAGAFGITAEEKTEIEDAVSDGGTLGWYSDQRPYVEKYVAWTQPVLTSDSTSTALGTITTSASTIGGSGYAYPYHALDGIKSGTGSGSSTGYWCCQSTSSQTGQWWQVVFPYQLKITGITFYNRYASNNYFVVNGQFWTSSDKTTAIGDRFQTANSAWASYVVTGIPSDGVVTDTLYFYINSGSDYCGIGELEITATRRDVLYEVPQRYLMQLIPAISESGAITNYYSPAIAPAHPYAHYEGTIYPIADAPSGAYPLTDLQYYTINYYVNAGGTLRWYSDQRPYVDDYVAWTQPVLTTNTTTVTDLGNVTATASSYGNNSGGSASGNEYPYHAMDGVKSGSGTTYWGCNASSPAGQWWQVVFPYQIKITGLTHYNRYGNSYANVTGQFWTSSDKTTPIGDAFGATGATGWKATTIENIPASGVVTDTIYFYITAGANYCGIGELEITATRYAILYEVPLTNFVS